MEDMKKPWYKKWWGILLVILFWGFLIPVVIFQSKASKKKKIVFSIIYIISVLLFFSLGSSSSNNTTTTANKNVAAEKKAEEKEKKVEKTEKEKKKETEQKVEAEKKRIREEFLSYEKDHLTTWNKMAESMQQSDISSSYEYADKSKKSIFEIWKKLQNLKCNATGDAEFDENCKKLIENGETAYLLKQTAVEKLMDWFENVNSPKKATEAKETLERAGEGWQMFQLQLALTTLSKEELEKWQKEAEQNKDSKK